MIETSTLLRTINSLTTSDCQTSSRPQKTFRDPPKTTANRVQVTAKMKLAFVLSTLSLLGVTHGYVVKAYDTADCSGDPETYDYASNGERSPIEASRSVKYQSDIGCVLSTYNSEGGQKATTRNQNSCFSPGYVIEGTVCY